MASQEPFDREAILSARELPDVYRRLVTMAEQFAVLGYVQTARDLVALLLSDYSSEWQLRNLRALAFGFTEAGIWPDGLPARWKTEQGIAELEEVFAWKKGFGDWNPEDDPVKTKEKLLAIAGPGNERGNLNMHQKLGFTNTTGALAMALSLAVQQLNSAGVPLEQIEQDNGVQQILAMILERIAGGDQVRALMERRNLWPLLVSGALARKMGVDDRKMRAAAKDAFKTFSERFKNGRKLSVLEFLSVPELVQRINDNTKASLRKDGEKVPKTLLVAPPADIEERIAALEKRVGETLPQDYKEFLRTSNGLGKSWSGNFLATPLYGVDDVAWAELEYMEDAPVIFHGEPSGVTSVSWESGRWPAWKETKALALSLHPDEPWSTLLLPPSETRKVFEAYEDALIPVTFSGSGSGSGSGLGAGEGVADYLLNKGSDTEMLCKLLASKFGDWEKQFLDKSGWMVVRDDLMIQGDTVAFGSFRMFLEELAIESKDGPKRGGWFAARCVSDEK